MKYLLSFILFYSFFLFAENNIEKLKENFIIDEGVGSGFFSEFYAVLGALDLYDREKIAGIHVNFNSGLYLESSRGPNWWEYYFEPIELGNKQADNYICSESDVRDFAFAGFELSSYRCFELIKKYIKINLEIQEEINQFIHLNFKDHYIICVHHRGTDKITEHSLVPYEKTSKIISNIISNLSNYEKNNLIIYVATDEQFFLDFLKKVFNYKIIHGDFCRSIDGKPVHYGNEYYSSNYQKGKEALIDCFLLSQGHIVIIPGTSCLSRASLNFNPSIPVIFSSQN